MLPNLGSAEGSGIRVQLLGVHPSSGVSELSPELIFLVGRMKGRAQALTLNQGCVLTFQRLQLG